MCLKATYYRIKAFDNHSQGDTKELGYNTVFGGIKNVRSIFHLCCSVPIVMTYPHITDVYNKMHFTRI